MPQAQFADDPLQIPDRWRVGTIALHRRAAALLLFAVWAGALVFLAAHHVMWRDEVRAFSLALQGEGFGGLLRAVHGEGHPALWYILLRAAHDVFGSPAVLPAVAAAIGLACAALLLFRSGLPLALVAITVFGRFFLFDDAVMARNYGIGLLLMFLFALAWQRGHRGALAGVILALLVNTSVHAVLLGGALLLFAALETYRADGLAWSGRWRDLLIAGAVAALGVGACLATVYPPFNDAATLGGTVSLHAAARAVLLPGLSFQDLFPDAVRSLVPDPVFAVLASLLLFGSVFAFAGSASGFCAVLAALLALSLFFTLIYPGNYRHEALWLGLAVTMLWLRPAAPARRSLLIVSRAGMAALVALLLLQLPGSARAVFDTLTGKPQGRARDLAALVQERPELAHAWIMGEPDFLVEALPYYLGNPTYLPREHRAGAVVVFSKQADLDRTLDDLLHDAERLRAQSGAPVLILLSPRLTASTSATLREGYDWTLTITPDAAQRFLAATHRIASFAPARSDESYGVYALR